MVKLDEFPWRLFLKDGHPWQRKIIHPPQAEDMNHRHKAECERLATLWARSSKATGVFNDWVTRIPTRRDRNRVRYIELWKRGGPLQRWIREEQVVVRGGPDDPLCHAMDPMIRQSNLRDHLLSMISNPFHQRLFQVGAE